MIDIHCHILSDLDDGAGDMRESVEMARIAFEDGIRHIVATPHFTLAYRNTAARVQRKVRELQQELDRQGIAVTIHPGNEVRLESKAFIYDQAKSDQFSYLDPAQNYVLLEQRWSDFNPETLEVVKWFLRRNTRPIVPHPERHVFFRRQPELVEQLIQAGMWTQVTADSLNGNNGEEVRRFAEWLLANDYVHVLATDAHNVRRKPNLSSGYDAVRKLAGNRRAEQIMERTQRILFPKS
ncbi:hypothetical protein DUZ99_02420 [Xylanibacillus composti]|uniref:Tyrosine-protein phosphatase n=1 Tax=Xylanibacillus composti TaxID=1572762 RepID=A0A8J4M1B7_9BACL|nr:CpsB/CapC family capsule biosynthesis tyrosine phosphatase [Xylanibacillus composti]MDT9723850.1 hypothetical protein [Xylanibacillus composti]GIQ67371.1 tyrosine protein phosphatase [Xylanibacillus composti]